MIACYVALCIIIYSPLNNAHTTQMLQHLRATFVTSYRLSDRRLNLSELTLSSGVVPMDFNQHLQSFSIFLLLYQKSTNYFYCVCIQKIILSHLGVSYRRSAPRARTEPTKISTDAVTLQPKVYLSVIALITIPPYMNSECLLTSYRQHRTYNCIRLVLASPQGQ